jgi:phosphoribosylglycinamide formyltransferase-1
MTESREDPRLTQPAEICQALPGAVREEKGRHAVFLVRGRTFAYFLDDHHGDGVVAVTCRAMPGEQEVLLTSGAERFFKPAYLGARGWIGIRLDLGPVDWDEVGDVVADSHGMAEAAGRRATSTSGGGKTARRGSAVERRGRITRS